MTNIDLTTVERVKRHMGQAAPATSNTEMDTLLGVMITAVSQAFAQYLGFPSGLMTESRTETYSVRQFQRVVRLDHVTPAMAAPTITSVKTRTHWSNAWADQTALTADTDYALTSDNHIEFSSAPPAGTDTVQVVYSSGFGANTAAAISTYPDLCDAADVQIVWEYHRRKDPGQNTTSVQGSVSTQQEVRLLTLVRDRITPYMRIAL